MSSEISLEISAILSFVREPDYKDYKAQDILLIWEYTPVTPGTIMIAHGGTERLVSSTRLPESIHGGFTLIRN